MLSEIKLDSNTGLSKILLRSFKRNKTHLVIKEQKIIEHVMCRKKNNIDKAAMT